MTGMVVPKDAKEVSFSAVKIKADGTREDLGVVAYWHKNPFKRLMYRIKRALGRI